MSCFHRLKTESEQLILNFIGEFKSENLRFVHPFVLDQLPYIFIFRNSILYQRPKVSGSDLTFISLLKKYCTARSENADMHSSF